MEIDDDHDDDYLGEDALPSGERTSGVVSATEVLTRVEHDLAYSSEKVLNLEILLMQVAGRANDYEVLTLEKEDIPTESLTKASEFSLLSGILNSEIKELEGFMSSLQIEIVDAHQKISQDFSNKSSTQIEVKLRNAEESFKQSRELIADIRTQSEKFERTLVSSEHETWTGVDEDTENGHLSSVGAKWKPQTVDQQRHCLQMLEKSLATELDLEKKLSESRSSEEVLKMKLNYAEQEAYFLEESIEIILERVFEAENAAEIFQGISKELAGEVQRVQFNLNGALHRECQMKSKLQEIMMKLSAEESALKKLKTSQAKLESSLKANLKEAEDKCALASSEALTLREKVAALEEQLRESESQSQLAKASVEASHEQKNLLHSELNGSKNIIEDLRETVLKSENRAENAETNCALLTKTNKELNEELGFLRNNGTDKANILERKLKESDTQLEHAKVSVEAIEERQNVLYSALSDMENLIEDLKGKVSKAESRAESAESKCTLLTETNLELNEELGFVRCRLECLETSLHQADDARIATAKDIGIRTKIIADLVMKLSSERERLQLQISALAKKNKILAEKCLKTKDNVSSTMNHKGINSDSEFSVLKTSKEAVTEFATTNFQVEKSATTTSPYETSFKETVSAEDDFSGLVSKLETVRTIEAMPLNLKYLFLVFVAVLVSVVAVYLFQLEP